MEVNREETLRLLVEATDSIMDVLERHELDDEAAEDVLDLLCNVHAALGPCDCHFCSEAFESSDALKSVTNLSNWSLHTNPPKKADEPRE